MNRYLSSCLHLYLYLYLYLFTCMHLLPLYWSTLACLRWMDKHRTQLPSELKLIFWCQWGYWWCWWWCWWWWWGLANCPAMSFLFVCWHIWYICQQISEIQISLVGWSTRWGHAADFPLVKITNLWNVWQKFKDQMFHKLNVRREDST